MMKVSSVFSTIVTFTGGTLLVIALLSGGASLLSLIERLRHGPGLLFADVEFFGLVAFICECAGGLAIFGAKKLSKPKQVDASKPLSAPDKNSI
jgi:hypothetical protein